jgi:hypothetical protein
MSVYAYWISPGDDHYLFTTTHINFIKDNPSLFGLASADIQSSFENHQDKSTAIPKAERVIIKSFLRKGWVKIQLDPNSNSWTIKYSVRVNNIKKKIQSWIQYNDILANGTNFNFVHSNIKPIFVYNREIVKFLTVKNYTIEERCLNCKHSVWAVGIGQGFFCRNKDKIRQGGNRVVGTEFRRFLIPNRNYVCEIFEKKL